MLLFIALLWGCSPDEEVYNNFCKELGFNYSDFHIDTSKFSEDFDIKISCNRDIQIEWRCLPKKYCAKKWVNGMCMEQKIGLICENIITKESMWVI